MNITQLQDNLHRLFYQEGHGLVFWYDPEQAFTESLPELELGSVQVLNLKDWPSLELKLKLEREDTEGKYLLYAPFAEPDPKEDWLLDVKLYSHVFRADQASIVLDELGLEQHSLRGHLELRKKFFRSKDRLNRLKHWVDPNDGQEELDKKMLAVATKAEYPSVFSVGMQVLSEFAESPDQADNLKSWDFIVKSGLEDTFWSFIQDTFGYKEQNLNLQDLSIRLLVTDLVHNLNRTSSPKSLSHFLLPEGISRVNCTVFLSQWRNHVFFYPSYNNLAEYLDRELQLDQVLANYEPEALLEVMTFPSVEKKIVRSLRDRIIQGGYHGLTNLQEILDKRMNGHWAGKKEPEDQVNLYAACYQAMTQAIDLQQLRDKYQKGLSFFSPERMFQAYTSELYLADQIYRLFFEQADLVETGGWDVLKGLQESIEDCYAWFLEQISLTWDGFFAGQEQKGFLEKWSLTELDIQNQKNFFSTFIQPILRQTPRTRVFVIVSDAFRYEAAQELLQNINSKYRFQGKLKSMLGVVPSYTALGMASLLPQHQLQITEHRDVLADQKPTNGLELRAKLLSDHEGTAFRAETLFGMNKEQGRELIKPYRVVYIYHDRIDSTGDTASSEDKTFEAVRKSIEEIDALVRLIINSLNGTHVFVTADHGFIFSKRPPQEMDKSGLDFKPETAVETKKRFILGKNLGTNPKVWHGWTKDTAKTGDEMEFWIPKGVNRFHFLGGSKFIHGGASLQEVTIPVIAIREMKGKEVSKSEVRKTGVSILGSSKKITSTTSRFQFIQTEAVTDRIKPRSLLISIRDGNELISNEEKLTFDSRSQSLDDRKKSVKLTLKPKQYQSNQDYYLVMRDSENQIEYERIPFKIDLAFIDEF